MSQRWCEIAIKFSYGFNRKFSSKIAYVSQTDFFAYVFNKSGWARGLSPWLSDCGPSDASNPQMTSDSSLQLSVSFSFGRRIINKTYYFNITSSVLTFVAMVTWNCEFDYCLNFRYRFLFVEGSKHNWKLFIKN